MKVLCTYVGKSKDFEISESKVNENLEKEMALIMSKMMQLEREIRVGKEAEKQ